MRFSVIVPVYNVEKYIRNCLNSIVMQTYDDYEVLVINDGTKDNSQSIIDEYVKKYPQKIKSFIKDNGGLSDARNYGVRYSKGDFLVFVDSDDFIEPLLLEKLNDEINKDNTVDVIGYHTEIFDKDYNLLEIWEKPVFSQKKGEDALIELIRNAKIFETAWGYCYNKTFWNSNNFEYAVGKLHEDLGLTPEVILKAKSVSIVDYNAYGYYQSENSIMRNEKNDYDKEYRKTLDLIFHYEKYKEMLSENRKYSTKAKKELLNYLVSSILWKFNVLSDEYVEKLRIYVKSNKLMKYKINRGFNEKKYFALQRIKYKF